MDGCVVSVMVAQLVFTEHVDVDWNAFTFRIGWAHGQTAQRREFCFLVQSVVPVC